MPIGIGEHHEVLRHTVRRWLETCCPPRGATCPAGRRGRDHAAVLGRAGGPGMARASTSPEEHGGQGFGMLELAVVVEEMARAVMPGPSLPTVLAAAVVVGRGGDDAQRKALLARPARRHRARAVALPGSGGPRSHPCRGRHLARDRGSRPRARRHVGDRGWLVPVSVHDAAGDGPAVVWCMLDLAGDQVTTTPLGSLDPTRRVGTVRTVGSVVVPERQLPSVSDAMVRDLALVARRGGVFRGARWCLDTGAAYAVERRQFGRPIGQFQAVKHRLADMLVSVEQVTALAWDAAQSGRRRRPRPGAAVGRPGRGPRPRRLRRLRQGLHPGARGAWGSPGSTTPTCTCAGP